MDGERFALVTGAGSGVGKASALALARTGWHVALTGRRSQLLEETAGEVKALGRRALPAAADVADPEAVKALFASVEREFGRLDLLFNNAGRAGRAGGSDRRTALRDVEGGGRRQPQWHVSLRPGRVRPHEAPETAGRADHQQRLDLGAHAKTHGHLL
jgi:NAD(P)-dependent dehydrogenase (short-subunit alcohol dehydrogenase family)